MGKRWNLLLLIEVATRMSQFLEANDGCSKHSPCTPIFKQGPHTAAQDYSPDSEASCQRLQALLLQEATGPPHEAFSSLGALLSVAEAQDILQRAGPSDAAFGAVSHLLPEEIQTWVKKQCPENGEEAVALWLRMQRASEQQVIKEPWHFGYKEVG